MPSATTRTHLHARSIAGSLALLVVGLLVAACASEESAAGAEEARAVLRTASPERFTELLRARYAAERACLEQRFPATVILSPGDTSRRARLEDERYTRPYELLRAVGLLNREEVHPGDRDWNMPKASHVDSGGPHRIVRYALTEGAQRDAQATEGGQHLCYARPRFVVVDSVVTRGLAPSWSPGEGVRYSQAVAYARHVVMFDSVAPWAREVARRDSLQDFGMLRPALIDGPQRRWAELWVRDGGWMYTGMHIDAPQ